MEQNTETKNPSMDQKNILDKYECKNYDTCHNLIYFTEKDQEYYLQKGWTYPDGSVVKPKYCKPCRVQRKADKAQHGNY